MVRKSKWKTYEEELLINNYSTHTISELMELLPGRSQLSINNKIKRLKQEGKITKEKEESAINRAYEQRNNN